MLPITASITSTREYKKIALGKVERKWSTRELLVLICVSLEKLLGLSEIYLKHRT